MHARAALSAALVASALGLAVGDVQCRDQNGNAVDWWAMFKLPDGYQAAYWTSTEPNNKLNVNADLSNADNPLHQCVVGRCLARAPACPVAGLSLPRPPRSRTRTLNGVWQNQGHVLYNDEHPDSAVAEAAAGAAANATGLRGMDWVKYGHTKGVIAFDGTTGFWLVHSVPRFPEANDWSYPEDETIYGQSFLCVSLDAGGIEDVGRLLVLDKPSVYASNMPSSYADQVRGAEPGHIPTHAPPRLQPPAPRSSPLSSACWPSSGTRRLSRTTRFSFPRAARPSSRSARTGSGTRWAPAAAAGRVPGAATAAPDGGAVRRSCTRTWSPPSSRAA